MQINNFSGRVLYFALFMALVTFYCFAYAPYGLENNDGGFILGLAHQFHNGRELYEEIVYVRPPMSIILHSIVFLPPFDYAPVISSRIIVYLQIAIYSGLSGILLGRCFNLSFGQIFLISALSFIFSAHNFPPIAWHTIDGIFFSVVSIYLISLKERQSILLSSIAMIFAFMAALSKQSFYITPLLVFGLMMVSFNRKSVAIGIASTLIATVITFLIIIKITDVQSMLAAISSQTKINDLISAGFVDYLRDWIQLRTLLFSGPMAIFMLLAAHRRWSGRSHVPDTFIAYGLIVSILFYIVGIFQLFIATDSWVSPQQMADSIFVITGLTTLFFFVTTRENKWLVVASLHVIAWAASISWGYKTTLLFYAPVIATVFILLVPYHTKLRQCFTIGTGILAASLVTFWFGQQYLYSLEGSVRRVDSMVHIGEEFSALKGIYTTEAQVLAYRELRDLTSKLNGPVFVGPNWPLYNVVFGGVNPIGIDWLLNAETGSYQGLIEQRLQAVEYFIVFRNARPAINMVGYFGSQITIDVVKSWQHVDMQSNYFDVYKNPQFNASSQ